MALLGLLFLFGAVVQYNDPDPLSWIAIYVAASVACFMAAADLGTWIVAAAISAVALLWALSLLTGAAPAVRIFEMFAAWEMKSERVEVAREMYGLLLTSISTAAVAVARYRRSRHGLISRRATTS